MVTAGADRGEVLRALSSWEVGCVRGAGCVGALLGPDRHPVTLLPHIYPLGASLSLSVKWGDHDDAQLTRGEESKAADTQ